MKYIVVCDYAYWTSKKFFINELDAYEYQPKIAGLLSHRYYVLESYNESPKGINYNVNVSSRIDLKNK